MKFGAGLALTSDPVAAVDQLVADAGGPLGGDRPSLAVLFASSHFLAEADSLLSRVAEKTGFPPLVGCVAESVLGLRREAEEAPAVSLWLAAGLGPVETFSMEFLRTSTGGAYCGYNFDQGVHLMITDPYTFPVEPLLSHLNERVPGAAVIGGLASGGAGLGQGRLFLDDQVLQGGAVGARLASDLEVALLISQGCRPVGNPYTITRAEGNVIQELGGQPPLTRLQHLARSATGRDRQLLSNGVHIGIVIDEYKVDWAPGDFLIRPLIGADSQTGAIVIGDEVDIGQTVQFHVRDASSADQDLRRTLEQGLAGRQVSGALLFACNGRGRGLFGEPDHDVSLISKVGGEVPLAGFFCAGELGPVGGKNFLHGFTASIAAFLEGGSTTPG
jgi:small ligand-binding sensory domain FIST